MIVDMPQLNGDESVKDLIEHVARLQKMVQFLMNGKISSNNVREIGGYNVNDTELISKDGDVGLSSEDTGGDDVRFHAGGLDKNSAPWRVHKSGKMVATGALIQSADGTYPKVVIDPENELIGAYGSPENYVIIEAFSSTTSTPAIIMRDGSSPITALLYLDPILNEFNIVTSRRIRISTGVTGYVQIDSDVKITDWSHLVNQSTSQTLQQALDSKGVSLAFDPTTRNLKLYGATGTLLSTVNIPLT